MDKWKNPYQRYGYVHIHAIVLGDTDPRRDIELFFGPMHPNDVVVYIPAKWSMAKLLSYIGVFESTKDADRNGWRKPIPAGYSEFSGKTWKVWIFNMKLTPQWRVEVYQRLTQMRIATWLLSTDYLKLMHTHYWPSDWKSVVITRLK